MRKSELIYLLNSVTKNVNIVSMEREAKETECVYQNHVKKIPKMGYINLKCP